MTKKIAFARGDGIGPEIASAVERILKASTAPVELVEVELGEQAYLKGESSGLSSAAWDAIRQTDALLKAPLTTPQGKGYKSVNVTLRKGLGLFANVRPNVAYDPVLPSTHPALNLTVIRENEEDLYAGIEHRQTQDVTQCLKLITRSGSERIIRYAFEYAKASGHTVVSCISKDNIMKITDGLFHSVFNEVATEYPEIEANHWIVDIGAARIAAKPQLFQTIVTTNLYGDILSDIAAEVTGSVGLAGSANIGFRYAMFEAVHGSAPDIAGRDIANPSGLLHAAILMLTHLELHAYASVIHKAWLRCLEDGWHTRDIANEVSTKEILGTQAFADHVIECLGKESQVLASKTVANLPKINFPPYRSHPREAKALVGVDVFVESPPASLEDLVRALRECSPPTLKLEVITNRGMRVWPDGFPETLLSDHWRCRFLAADRTKSALSATAVVNLLESCVSGGLEVIKTENLYNFDGQPGYSLPQSA